MRSKESDQYLVGLHGMQPLRYFNLVLNFDLYILYTSFVNYLKATPLKKRLCIYKASLQIINYGKVILKLKK